MGKIAPLEIHEGGKGLYLQCDRLQFSSKLICKNQKKIKPAINLVGLYKYCASSQKSIYLQSAN